MGNGARPRLTLEILWDNSNVLRILGGPGRNRTTTPRPAPPATPRQAALGDSRTPAGRSRSVRCRESRACSESPGRELWRRLGGPPGYPTPPLTRRRRALHLRGGGGHRTPLRKRPARRTADSERRSPTPARGPAAPADLRGSVTGTRTSLAPPPSPALCGCIVPKYAMWWHNSAVLFGTDAAAPAAEVGASASAEAQGTAVSGPIRRTVSDGPGRVG